MSEKRNITGFLITAFMLSLAVIALLIMFKDYFFHPWTRDGQVSAQVIMMTPRVSGPIIDLPIIDNQFVKKGDLLMKIDPRTFQVKVDEARATLLKAEAAYAESQAENARIQGIYERDKEAVSIRKVTATEHAMQAAYANVKAAEANLDSALLDLEFTEIKAPVDGYITNLNLQRGSQAIQNQPALALVDSNDIWVTGFFKETHIRYIKRGDNVTIQLMSYPETPIKGVVESLGWGIAQQDGSTGEDLLPNVNPSFDWIRLAQRIPVRIKLTSVPEGVALRAGSTASIIIEN